MQMFGFPFESMSKSYNPSLSQNSSIEMHCSYVINIRLKLLLCIDLTILQTFQLNVSIYVELMQKDTWN